MTLVLIISACAFVALIATGVHYFVHKRMRTAILEPYNEVTAAVYATFGVLYAVILGLLVSHGQTRRDVVMTSSVREAAMLVDVAQAARTFGPGPADSVRTACLVYADHVRSIEWNISSNDTPPLHQHRHFDAIWEVVRRIDPVGPRQEGIYLSMLDVLGKMSEERYERLAATGDHMSLFLKVVLLLGAAVTVAFLWFFGMNDNRIHLAYTWLVTLMLSLVLVLIFALDNPMQIGVGVHPIAYERAIYDLNGMASN
ncbi:MAG: DUF4239 domain-containing protein [Candidatus Kapabacteria bacterium]|nr:DUF4239 domain-containing protein [Candidatus Kapabacteria bacterium]